MQRIPQLTELFFPVYLVLIKALLQLADGRITFFTTLLFLP